MTPQLLPRRDVVAALLAGACLPLELALASAGGAPRVALVIGNAAYPSEAALSNPVNDARAMGQVLGELGFRVVLALDAGSAKMRAALAEMRALLGAAPGSVGMQLHDSSGRALGQAGGCERAGARCGGGD
jgi:hypothetical protein